MKNLLSTVLILFAFCVPGITQNSGIGTTTPQAKLDVNGTFKLQQGVTANTISTDTTFEQASDEILPTQLAVKKYLEHGTWVPGFQTPDSSLVLRDSLGNQQTLIWVDVQGSYAYALRAASGLYIYDITDPDSIILRGSTIINMNSPQRICVQGDYAYVTSYGNNKLNIYNISNPDNIIALGTTSQNLSGPWGLYVEGAYAYVTSFDNDRLCIFNISNPNSIIAVSYTSHADMDGPEMVWKQNNFIWVTSQFGEGTGYVHRFDVSNPASPQLKGASNQQLSRPHDVQTSGTYAFVTSQMNHSVVVFDGSNPNEITQVAVLSSGLSHPNHLSVSGKYAYVTSSDQNSHIRQINITDPLNPFLRLQILEGYSNPNAAICAYENFLVIAGASNHTLWLFELTPLLEDRRVSINQDGNFSYDFGVWQIKHQLDQHSVPGRKYYDMEDLTQDRRRIIYRINGNVGIGTDAPQAKLHITGDQKFYGYNQYLEFGAGIPGKEINAGTIYYTNYYVYQIYLRDKLNIVGGGTAGHRKLALWADEVMMTGPLESIDSLHFFQKAYYQGAKMNKQIGIFCDPHTIVYYFTCYAPDGYHIDEYRYRYNLSMLGAIRIMDNGTGSGFYLNPFETTNEQGVYLGMKDTNTFGMRRNSTWPLQIKTSDNHIGLFNTPDPVHMLKINHHLQVFGNLTVNGELRIYQNSNLEDYYYLEFGAGINNKHPESGKLYTNNIAEISFSGAGPNIASQKIKLWAEGGIDMTDDFNVQGNVSATSIATTSWEDLTAFFQNGWTDYGGGYVEAAYYKDPSGVVHLRGLITGGSNQQNTVICRLPEAHRPVYGHMIFAVVNGVDTLGRIDVESDGDVVFRGSTNTFLSLDQIEFRTF